MNFRKFLIILFSVSFLLLAVQATKAATLSLSPASGTFTVDSIFDVSLFLNTQSESVNAIEVHLKFPPDKLQLVSPSVGKSIIGIWTAPPEFNNQKGEVILRGGIPNGINVSTGLVTKLTFRVKSVGDATLKFLDDSKTLLNDGKGTDVLRDTSAGIYNLTLPPPAGPIVVSETHPDQSRWYSNQTVILNWSPETDVEGYSYVLNNEPIDVSDDIPEGLKRGVVYKNLSDGVHYFHIKSLRDNAWGGITNFAINIDITPPADFPVIVSPSDRTKERKPVVEFETTDALSGIDHYELQVVPLGPAGNLGEGAQPIFIEATSPYILPKLELGTYDVIVRAYDKAGNFRESTKHLRIIKPLLNVIADKGLRIKDWFVIPWLWIWIIVGIVVAGLAYLALRIRKWHKHIDIKRAQKELPAHLKNQLRELKEYKKKYGRLAILILAAGAIFLGQIAVAGEEQQIPQNSRFVAQISDDTATQKLDLEPPLVTTISRNISNEEIFYIGGKIRYADTEVIIYLQNLQSGEASSQITKSDKKGDWFYRHNTFLSSGNYLLWVQSKVGERMSPPSPQIQMNVRPTAIQFGSSRLSYEILYLILVVILSGIAAGLILYIIYHGYHGRKKKKLYDKEIKEAEESVHRGFAVLRRDIQAELEIIKKAKLSKALSDEEKKKEEQLLKDFEWAERYIGKEIWDVERELE